MEFTRIVSFERFKKKPEETDNTDNPRRVSDEVQISEKDETFSCLVKANQCIKYISEKCSSVFRETFEIDKTTEEMVSDIRKGFPVPVSSVDEIFDACKRETLMRAVSAFGLAPVIQGLDSELAAKFKDLSVNYGEFAQENNLHADPNFRSMQRERELSRDEMLGLENGYNTEETLFPRDADIEHVIAKERYFDSFLLKAGLTDEELVQAMNVSDNLIFADKSFNRSKSNKDLLEYIEDRKIDDPQDENLLHFDINGRDVVIDKKDSLEKYEAAQHSMQSTKAAAAKELGVAMASSGARLAVQQVVGLILVETVDIFVDEIRDMAVKGNTFTGDGMLARLQERTGNVRSRLQTRFEERNIFRRARELGIESGMAGVLGMLPQLFLAMALKMPAFILAMLRECTLSAVRCVRIMMTPDMDRYAAIKTVVAGTATAVMGVYIARTISTVITPVPLIAPFRRQATEVLTALFVTIIPLCAIYFFEKNKNVLKFKLREEKDAAAQDSATQPEPSESAEDAAPAPGILEKAAAEACAAKEGMAEAVKSARNRATELFRFRSRTTESGG